VFVTHFADGNMSWFDTERPHIVILCKHKLQKYYLSNSKSTKTAPLFGNRLFRSTIDWSKVALHP